MLAMDITKIDKRLYSYCVKHANELSVLIATPFYQSVAYTNYLHSLFCTVKVLDAIGIKNNLLIVNGDSYIDRARNGCIMKFLKDEDNSDFGSLFFIDSDMGWDVSGFLLTLACKYEFVGAAYPTKNNWQDWSLRHYTTSNNAPQVTEDGFIVAHMVPAGFMRLRRSCLEKMADHYSARSYIDPSSIYKKITPSLFECSVDNLIRLGEDYEFCNKWRNMGGKMYCVPDVTISHLGVKVHEGNYHDFLMHQPGAVITGGQQAVASVDSLREILKKTEKESLEVPQHA